VSVGRHLGGGNDGLRWSIDVRAVERARILRGWTRADLAHAAGLDPSTVGDSLAGRRRPTFGSLRALCFALGLGLGDVIAFEADEELLAG
jgi:transcriptional regulator with XRE-family HTH domain